MPCAVERLVVNTGPLVSLGRIGALGLVGALPIQFVAPTEVAREIEAGIALGHPVGLPPWLEVIGPAGPLDALALQTLDAGEAAVIGLALELGIRRVCIDEWRGRRAAGAVGLQVTGSLGLLGRAKQLGLTPTVRPWVERLVEAGVRLHPELLQRFLEALNESR